MVTKCFQQKLTFLYKSLFNNYARLRTYLNILFVLSTNSVLRNFSLKIPIK